MGVSIRLAGSMEGALREWADSIVRGLSGRFGEAMSAAYVGPASPAESGRQIVLFVKQSGKGCGEILLRREAEDVIVAPQAARRELDDHVSRLFTVAERLQVWAFVAGLLLAILAWIAFIVWFWSTWWAIRGVRGKVFWALVIVMGWLASMFGLAALAEHLAARLDRLLDGPRRRRSEQWLHNEVWPWLESYLRERQSEDASHALSPRTSRPFQIS